MGIYSHQEMTDNRDFQPQTIAKLKPEEFTEHSYCLCKEKGIYIQQNPTGHGSMTRHQEVDSLMAISKLNGNIHVQCFYVFLGFQVP